jgi:hypothetical protein
MGNTKQTNGAAEKNINADLKVNIIFNVEMQIRIKSFPSIGAKVGNTFKGVLGRVCEMFFIYIYIYIYMYE